MSLCRRGECPVNMHYCCKTCPVGDTCQHEDKCTLDPFTCGHFAWEARQPSPWGRINKNGERTYHGSKYIGTGHEKTVEETKTMKDEKLVTKEDRCVIEIIDDHREKLNRTKNKEAKYAILWGMYLVVIAKGEATYGEAMYSMADSMLRDMGIN